MNPNWRSFLESADAVFDGASDEILNFGDAAGELQAARSQTVLVPLTHLALIEAVGEDAKSFLHSQFTSDINHLGADQVQHSAWCTAKGRMQASFLAWREGDAYQLALAADLEATSLKRLQMFVLRAKVKLATLTDSRVLLGIAGPQAGAALARRDAWLARNVDEALVVWDGKDPGLGRLVRTLEDRLGEDVWIVDPAELATPDHR